VWDKAEEKVWTLRQIVLPVGCEIRLKKNLNIETNCVACMVGADVAEKH
jgi:hypothetical protein